MFEIKMEQANNLYNELKNTILLHKDEVGYSYQKKQHHLYEPFAQITKEMQANYYDESGRFEFQNIVAEISRWHVHKHNGLGGLNGNPCLTAIIYDKDNGEENPIWKLLVTSGTLYYNAVVTNLEIPKNVLIETKDEKGPIEKPKTLIKVFEPKKDSIYNK